VPLYMGALGHLEQLYDTSILCDPLNSGNKARCTLSDCCKKVLVTQYIESLILYDDVLGTVLFTQIETSYTAK